MARAYGKGIELSYAAPTRMIGIDTERVAPVVSARVVVSRSAVAIAEIVDVIRDSSGDSGFLQTALPGFSRHLGQSCTEESRVVTCRRQAVQALNCIQSAQIR